MGAVYREELSANARKLIEQLLSLPQGWVTAAMLAESIGVSRRTVLRELPSVEQWIAAAGYRFVRSPGQGLLLDEPPNHLDVEAKEELKRALKEYRGSILLICHEPEFYEGVATKVWDCREWALKLS